MKTRNRSLHKADTTILIFCLGLFLLPSLAAVNQQGRRRAREAVCLANQRQWHAVFQNYIADHNGAFFTGTTSSGYWWPTQLDQATQSWKQNRSWFCPEATRLMYNEDGITVPGSAQTSAWGIFRQQDYSTLGPDGIAGSYGLNGYTIDITGFGSEHTKPTYDRGIPASDGWHDFDTVTDADSIPLLLDAVRFDLWPLYSDAPGLLQALALSGGTDYMAKCCIDRHNGNVNSLFLDGSARKVGLKELWTLKWHRSYDTAGPWTRAGGVLPTDWPEWMRQFKDY